MAKSKTKKKSSAPSKRWEAYKVEGDKLIRLKKECPKCGKGIFLAIHEKPKKRYYCGKCSYTEYIS